MAQERKESDSLGEILVPQGSWWGAQTQRSLENFQIGGEKMPMEVIYALVTIKKAAAIVNAKKSLLPQDKAEAIIAACDAILAKKHDKQFPLSVWQTGSGTQTNMNVNEVIANLSISALGGNVGSKIPIHPNDDVNKSQSSNDTFPTAMHIAAIAKITSHLLPKIQHLRDALKEKAATFMPLVKVGRTHLMDATPITLGQEFSGYVAQLDASISEIHAHLPQLHEIAIGGTAVGTGLNAPQGFDKEMAATLATLTHIPFVPAKNKFAALASHDALVATSGTLKRLAVALMKIANDIRWMGSGPNCGLAELLLPANEPGSSIMPGKVNPTQCEALTMVCTQVIGNDTTITFAGASGQFELNVFKPLIIHVLLQSITLLGDAAESFSLHTIQGLLPNTPQLAHNLEHCLMLATLLVPICGYDNAAKAVKKAQEERISLKAAAVALGLVTSSQYDSLAGAPPLHPGKGA